MCCFVPASFCWEACFLLSIHAVLRIDTLFTSIAEYHSIVLWILQKKMFNCSVLLGNLETISGFTLKSVEHRLATRFRWVSITPFDNPVVPDENGRAHRSVWCTSSLKKLVPALSAASSSLFQFMEPSMCSSSSMMTGSPKPFTCSFQNDIA